jgi:hypothetical protein
MVTGAVAPKDGAGRELKGTPDLATAMMVSAMAQVNLRGLTGDALMVMLGCAR